MVDGATAERVHARLKTAIMVGAVSMHARLDIAELAASLGVSTTPVREAAMRLWGAGLLEPHPKGGMRAVLATEARLRGLLDLNERLLATALAMGGDHVKTIDHSAYSSVEARVRAIVRTIAERTANPALVEFVDGISDRLAVFRHRESEILDGVEAELSLLESALPDRSILRKALRRYHRRRLTHAPELTWATSAGSGLDDL